jgi:predicted aconitase with swiveling domain
MTGTVIENHHQLKGISFAGKVLVFPGAKGSSGWSGVFHSARLKGVAPLAMLFNVMTTKAALGSVVMRVPTVSDFDRDPLDLIQTGDWVRVAADQTTGAGVVEVWKGGRP